MVVKALHTEHWLILLFGECPEAPKRIIYYVQTGIMNSVFQMRQIYSYLVIFNLDLSLTMH